MKTPNLQEEKRLWRQEYKNVVCLDEVGRGALAGPVVAAAVSLKNNFRLKDLGLNDIVLMDSKKLTALKRQKVFSSLKNSSFVKWGIGRVYSKVIDRINIFEATKLAMKRALSSLERKNKYLEVDYIILDGKMKLSLSLPQKSIIKADEKVASCAIASIFAKVIRDRAMIRYKKKYTHYSFEKHKGYGTKLHFGELRKSGPSKIHRRTFSPVNKFA